VNYFALRLSAGAAILFALGLTATAQDSRQFYKTPQTTAEYWRYMKHEIELGHYQLADQYLKAFLAKEPSDEELLQIHDREGSSAFLRLLTIPEMRADAKNLIDRVNTVVQGHLGDRRRLDALIQNLAASPEERAYSIAQLHRSGALAIPALIDALIATANDPGAHSAILSALPKLGKATLPPLLAALDVDDGALRAELLEAVRAFRDASAVPYLWYYSASPKQTELVRRRATEALDEILHRSPQDLPPAKQALTQEAERYYQHQVSFADPAGVTIWRWDGKHLVSQVLPATQAEEYYALRFARQALDLDPSYLPAQVVFLSTALEKGFERGGLDQPLTRGSPAVHDLLRSVSSELLIAVLHRALNDQRLPVILGTTRALGDLAEVRAARSDGGGTPVLARALNYPDRRVQMAAADAILRIPVTPAPAVAARVVDVLRRAIATDGNARALIADPNEDRGHEVARAVRRAGYQPVVVQTGRDALRRLAEAADIDVLLIDAGIIDPMLPYLLAQLRADVDVGLLPVLVTTTPDRVERLQRQFERYRNVTIVPFSPAAAGAERLADTLRTAVVINRVPRALLADPDAKSATAIAAALKDAGFDPLVVHTGDELVHRLAQAADIDVVLIDDRIRNSQLEDLLPQIRATAAFNPLPIYLLTAPDRVGELEHVAERYRNVWVAPVTSVSGAIKSTVAFQVAQANDRPLSANERRDNAARAMEWLGRLARGELPGYDVRPAEQDILRALQVRELAPLAIGAAGALPSRDAQRALASVVLDPGQPAALRSAAAVELTRHLQQHGVSLTGTQVKNLEQLYAIEKDPKLRANMALVLGGMHPDSQRTGQRLESYVPTFTPVAPPRQAPAPAPKEKKEETPEKEGN
jgi:DNA-binding response OmpR family regulator